MPKGGSKRAAPSAGESGSSSRSTRHRGTAAAAGSLAESALSGDDASAILQRQSDDRDFWSQFATALLYTWLADYDNSPVRELPAADKLNRELLLDLLVTYEGVERPTKSKEKQELQAAWRRVEKVPARATAPAIEFISPAAAAIITMSDSSVERKYPEQPQDARISQPGGSRSDYSSDYSAAKVAAQLQATSAMQLAQGRQSELTSTQPASYHPAAAVSFHLAATPPTVAAASSMAPRGCATCSDPGPSIGEWRCTGCGLRGDVPTLHPANVFLAKRMEQEAAAASSSSSSSSSGQSHETLAAAAAAAAAMAKETKDAPRGLDAHFAALAVKSPPMPIFDGPLASGSIPHTDAIAIARRAVGATAVELPSEQLIALIRSGKLPSVGYAIPRLLTSAHSSEAVDVNASALYALGINPRSIGSLVAPEVPSSQAFCGALFATILPALIDRPAALMEWMTLARTALELESQHSWSVAYSYVLQVMNERIARGQGFSETSMSCLTTMWAALRNSPPAAAAAAPNSNHQPRQRGTCRNWNTTQNGCDRNPCDWRHVCMTCGGNHKSKDNVCSRPQKSNPPPRHPGGGGAGGGHGQGEKPKSSGSSVASLPSVSKAGKGGGSSDRE